jgi:thymidylate synthase
MIEEKKVPEVNYEDKYWEAQSHIDQLYEIIQKLEAESEDLDKELEDG